MTLNLTVVTPRVIYQSADYQLVNMNTAQPDFENKRQKIVLANTFKWSATICFAGVGRTSTIDVSEWLDELLSSIQHNDPFEHLLDGLVNAKKWLLDVAPPHNRHSFSIGAFIGSKPVFALVSNFEQLFGPPASTASRDLFVHRFEPKKPMTFVSGQRQAVTRQDRRRLAALAAGNLEPQKIYSALAGVNYGVSLHNRFVSAACFTTHVCLTGEGGGCVFNPDRQDIARPLLPNIVPPSARESITQLINQQLGPGASFRSISFVRADDSDNYHETQLREKPNSPVAHSNYGKLLSQKGDIEGAEREYRKAIELDCTHAPALGNLANVLWKKGDKDRAAHFYRKALQNSPGHENITRNYVQFLLEEYGDRKAANEAIAWGIKSNPDSSLLLLLRAEMSMSDGRALDALEDYRLAREKGHDQAEVEGGYAIALQVSGADISECIGAYRVSIALNPQNANLRLNLAQLLFIKGANAEAKELLRKAMDLGLNESAQLEAQFYLLSHTKIDQAMVCQKISLLLIQGARLGWDVRQNIKTVSQQDPKKAALLKLVLKVMTGEQEPAFLDQVNKMWPRK